MRERSWSKVRRYFLSFGWWVCTSSIRTYPATLAFLSLLGCTKYQVRPPPGNLYW